MAEFKEVMKQKKRMCEHCERDCFNCGGDILMADSDPDRFEKFVMDWAREHPVVTNKYKFKEIYGFEPSRYLNCPMKNSNHCMTRRECEDCEYENFWNQEYKEPKGEKK